MAHKGYAEAGEQTEAFETLSARVAELESLVAQLPRIEGAKRELEKTFDAVPDLIAIIDTSGLIMRVNRSLARRLSTSPQLLVGRPCKVVVCGSDVPPTQCPHARVIQEGTEQTVEMRIENLGGYFHITATPIRDAGGSLIGCVHVARDITRRKDAEATLLRIQQQQKALLDNIPDMAWLKDREGRYIAVSKQFARVCGRRPEDVAGKTDLDLWPRQRAEQYLAEDREVMASGARKITEVSMIDNLGGERWFDAIVTPISDEQGTVAGTAGIARDITEKRTLERLRRKMEEQLAQEQRDQSIAALAGGIAHDFNNMLLAVLGNAELLKLKLQLAGSELQTADAIIDAAERMAHLTGQLLAYSKQGAYHQTVLALNEAITEALSTARAGKVQEIAVDLDLQKDLWPVFADPGQIRQVIMNVLANAFEAMDKGTVTILTANISGKEGWQCPVFGHKHAAGDYVHLEISDTGEGIPLELHRRIFEPFYSTKFVGRGLGLAAAAGIIQHHGGCISLESAPGKGSTFHIYLPRLDAVTHQQDRERIPRAREKDMRQRTVLVVDDEAQILAIIGEIVASSGYPVMRAGSGAEALSLVQTHGGEIALAILDIEMPGMSGRELFRRLRVLQPDIKVLVASGYDRETVLTNFGEDMPDGFLQKPFRGAVLEKMIREALDDRE